MGMLTLAKVAQVSLENYSLPALCRSSGSIYIHVLDTVNLLNDDPCFGGQWKKDFSLLLNQDSYCFSCRLIFDPFIPLGIITLQCWSYLGLPNTNVVCVQERFLNVFNKT